MILLPQAGGDVRPSRSLSDDGGDEPLVRNRGEKRRREEGRGEEEKRERERGEVL